MNVKKYARHMGKKLKKRKTWEKVTSHGNEIETVGKILAMGGTASGQPEVVAVGGGLITAGKISKESNKLLKKKDKK